MKPCSAAMWAAAVLLALSAPPAAGEPDESGATAPRVFALVSAIGDRMTYVQNRLQAGSLIEPYRRSTLKLQDHSLNALVLLSLDRELAAQRPSSRRVHLALEPRVVHAAHPDQREKRALDSVMATLRGMSDREQWDEIIVVTPAYLLGQNAGMGPQLHGIGVYAHPVKTDKIIKGLSGGGVGMSGGSGGGTGGGTGEVIDPDLFGPKEVTFTPAGVEHRSRQYIALHFYARIWRFDAKTLELISKVDRFENLKFDDPDSGAVHYTQSVPASFLAAKLTTMVEESTASALRRAMGIVEVGPLETFEMGNPALPAR